MVRPRPTAHASGVRAMCGYNYRRVPAVSLMRDLVAAGRLGEIRHVRAVYLQDWIVDPEFPLVWRLQQGPGRFGRARRHRRAHRRPDPVRHRAADHRRQRADRDVRPTRPLPTARPVCRPAAGRRHRRTATASPGRGHRRRRGAVPRPPVRRRDRDVRGDPVRHRAQERAAGRGQRLARFARVRPGAAQRARVLRRHRSRRRSRASRASW